jgi:hypothetical protein
MSPFVCDIKYSSGEDIIGKHNDVVPSTTTRLAHHQICVIINPQMGAEISTGEHSPRANIE